MLKPGSNKENTGNCRYTRFNHYRIVPVAKDLECSMDKLLAAVADADCPRRVVVQAVNLHLEITEPL